MNVSASPAIRFSTKLTVLLPFLWIGVLSLSYFIVGKSPASIFLEPLLTTIAICLPLVGFLLPIFRQGRSISNSRIWGSLSVGAVVVPLVGILAEITIVVILFVSAAMVIGQNPNSMDTMEHLFSRMANAQTNPEVVKNILSVYLRQPMIQCIIFFFTAGFVPLLEEAVKQTPVWLLSGRKPTAAVGLMVGALAGAGFAFTESLLTIVVIQDPSQWVLQLIGRTGTGLMHVLTGAIGGWGLASVFQGRNYLRAVGSYLTAALIHGAWNGIAIWSGISRYIFKTFPHLWYINDKVLLSTLLLGGLFLIMLLILMENYKIFKD